MKRIDVIIKRKVRPGSLGGCRQAAQILRMARIFSLTIFFRASQPLLSKSISLFHAIWRILIGQSEIGTPGPAVTIFPVPRDSGKKILVMK